MPANRDPLQDLGAYGQANGSVTDEQGKPVPYARVFIAQALPAGAERPAPPPIVTGPQVAAPSSDAQGRFVAFLRPGKYVACAQTTTPGLLDPCHFGPSAPSFEVTQGKAVSGIAIVMAKGGVISAHIDDPKQLLSEPFGPIAADCRVQLVIANGYRYEVPFAKRTATGRDYQITVPYGQAVSIRVVSPNFVINDSGGKPVTDLGLAATAVAGQDYAFTLVVAGRDPETASGE
jgi:hypothetical protein